MRLRAGGAAATPGNSSNYHGVIKNGFRLSASVFRKAPERNPEAGSHKRRNTMPKKPTIADAQLILQLYDLRREAEMRKDRAWDVGEFFPESAEDCLKVVWAMGTRENAWMRQVGGYWGIVASFVLSGVLNEELFLAPPFSGEMFLIYAKIHPYIKELREKMGDPNVFLSIEKAITRTKWGRDRLQFTMKRVETMKQKRKANP